MNVRRDDRGYTYIKSPGTSDELGTRRVGLFAWLEDRKEWSWKLIRDPPRGTCECDECCSVDIVSTGVRDRRLFIRRPMAGWRKRKCIEFGSNGDCVAT
jgi:hypothetical protein